MSKAHLYQHLRQFLDENCGEIARINRIVSIGPEAPFITMAASKHAMIVRPTDLTGLVDRFNFDTHHGMPGSPIADRYGHRSMVVYADGYQNAHLAATLSLIRDIGYDLDKEMAFRARYDAMVTERQQRIEAAKAKFTNSGLTADDILLLQEIGIIPGNRAFA